MTCYLVVTAGRPGTGKTTLARALAPRLGAAYLRVDAVETAILRSGLAVEALGPMGYAVVHEVAKGTLEVGTPVVVDAVNPVHAARRGWRQLAEDSGARLVFLETVVPDEVEHRARVEARQADLLGQVVPTWTDVAGWPYEPWDDSVDGARHLIDMTDTASGIELALVALRRAPRAREP